jgi:hypothetical protein
VTNVIAVAATIVAVAILVVVIVDKASLLLLLLVAVRWMTRVLLMRMMKLRHGRLCIPHQPSFLLMKSMAQHQVADAIPAPKRIVVCGHRG